MLTTIPRRLTTALLAAVVATAFPTLTHATHSWGGYHWARTGNPFTLKLGDNVSGLWDGMLRTASSDWSTPTSNALPDVLDTTIVAGRTKPKSCRPTSGWVEVCNANYGNTGWLGVAQIWIIGGEHIVQGTVKNNDYYFGTSTYQYNNTAEMQHVICQEIGHTLGLDHQSTDGSSLDTCMDYYHNTSALDTRSTHPNAHDYEELGIIYGHFDSFDSFDSATSAGQAGLAGEMPSAMNDIDLAGPRQWGKLIRGSRAEGRSLYELDFGGGNKVFTFVIWAKEE